MNKITKQQKKLDRIVQQHYVPLNPECLVCGKPTAEMHHHIQKKQSLSLRYDKENLIPLCKGCHLAIHRKGDPAIIAKIIEVKGMDWHKKIESKRRIIVKRNILYYKELLKLEKMLI